MVIMAKQELRFTIYYSRTNKMPDSDNNQVEVTNVKIIKYINELKIN